MHLHDNLFTWRRELCDLTNLIIGNEYPMYLLLFKYPI